jgi:predicted HAD superfamily Cof-like phosphohydrolase
MIEDFDKQIAEFNKLYGLPAPAVPGIPFVNTPEATAKKQLVNRLANFKDILREELDEVDEIIQRIDAGDPPLEILTALADWLGDVQVYCASELAKFGIPNSMVLSIIMASNMSKLGANGKPIYDERGKVVKGPNYWRPEPMLARFIAATIRQEGEKK